MKLVKIYECEIQPLLISRKTRFLVSCFFIFYLIGFIDTSFAKENESDVSNWQDEIDPSNSDFSTTDDLTGLGSDTKDQTNSKAKDQVESSTGLERDYYKESDKESEKEIENSLALPEGVKIRDQTKKQPSSKKQKKKSKKSDNFSDNKKVNNLDNIQNNNRNQYRNVPTPINNKILDDSPSDEDDNVNGQNKESFFAPLKNLPEKNDQIQKKVSDSIIGLADQLDSFFGDKRSDDEKNTSTLRLGPTIFLEEGNTPVESFELNLNLKFPRLEKRGNEIVNNTFRIDDNPTKTQEPLESYVDALDENGQVIRKKKPKSENDWIFSLEERVIVKQPISAYAGMRLRRNMPGSYFIHRFYTEAGWSTESLWHSKISLNSDAGINEKLLFRWINEIDWDLSHSELSTSHGPVLIQNLDLKKSLSYSFQMATAVIHHALITTAYALGINYRQMFDAKWMFLEISPQLSFPRANGFNHVAGITFKFEYNFGPR